MFDRDDYCFACGKNNECGLRLDIETDSGKSMTTLKFKDFSQGYNGIVHGGILATVIDEMTVYAANSLGGDYATAELSIRYKKPVNVDGEYRAEGNILEKRGRMVKAEARIVDLKDEVRVTGTAKLIKVND